jgi:hypothetical protein
MLKRISKRVTNAVDKLQMSAVVHLNRIFWDDTRNDTSGSKVDFVMRQFTLMPN